VKVWFQNQRSKLKRQQQQRTGDEMTSHHSTDSCLFISHQHQLLQQAGVSMATVAKETRSDINKENDLSFASLRQLASPSKIHAVSWRPK